MSKKIDVSQSELRKKHRLSYQDPTKSLTHEESRRILEYGNSQHQIALNRFKSSPEARFNTILNGEADYVHIRCSDSRVSRSDHEFDTFVGMQIRVAGNVIPKSGVSVEEIREVVKLVKPGGIVLLTSHTKCGAIVARAGWKQNGKQDTGNGDLNTLLTTVDKDTPQENLIVQAGRANMLLDGQILITGHYDWDSGTIELHNHPSASLGIRLRANIIQNHRECDDGELFSLISNTQKPHTIAVSYHKLPFSMNTIFRAEPGEVFGTTGSESGMDACDRASLLYAAEHVGTKHIAFLAPNIPNVESMFALWEANIREMVVNGKKIFEHHLNSGILQITKYVYDLKNGVIDRS